jgi:hypothetical protein
MSSVTGISRKKPMAVSLKKWRKAGETVDRRAHAYMKREPGLDYMEAVKLVLRKDSKLRLTYHSGTVKEADPFAGLRSLADYLNRQQTRPPKDRDPLASILHDFKHRDSKQGARQIARMALEQKLMESRIECIPFLSRDALSVGWIFPLGIYGTIARALHGHLFSALHCCRWCATFFVHQDHRRDYCSAKCLSQRETYRVKLWRARSRSEAQVE